MKAQEYFPTTSRALNVAGSHLLQRISAAPALIAVLIVLGVAEPVSADADVKMLTVNAEYRLQRDSNLFRLADGQKPVIDGIARDRTDSRQSGEIGLKFDQTWGRQHVTADASATRTYFSDFDFLDFAAHNYKGQWDWGIGKRWLGSLSASQIEALRSFADFSLPVRSINTYRTYSALAGMWVLPNWTAGVGFTRVVSENDDAESALQDYDEDAWETRVTYRPASANELSLIARVANGEYPNRDDIRVVDRSYEQRDLRLEGRYAMTAHGRLSGYAGIAQREYPRTRFRDYSGPIGRIAYEWSPTVRLQIEAQLRRELGAQEDQTDTYVVTTASGLTVSWQLSQKVRSKFWAELLSRDYQGDPGFGLSPTSGEKDEQIAYGASLRYVPFRRLDVSLSYEKETRRRGIAERGFDNTIARFEARFRY